MRGLEDSTKEYRRVSAGMFLGSLVTFALLYSPQTLIVTLAEEYRITPSTSGLALSSATLSLAIGMTLVTLYRNRIDRKTWMTLSLFAASALNVSLAYCPDFPALLTLRIAQGLALGGFPAVAMAYIGELLGPGKLGRAIGIYVSGSVIGAFLGRLSVSVLTDIWAWKPAVFVLGIGCLGCCLAFAACLRTSKGSAVPTKRPAAARMQGINLSWREPRLLALYMLGFIFLGVYVALFNFIGFPLSLPPYSLSQTMIGFLFVFQVAGCWSSYLFGRLTESVARPRLLGWSIVMTMAGAGLTLSPHLILLSLGLLLFVSGFLAGHSVASSWVAEIAAPDSGAYASALYLLFYYAGASVLGWLGGVFLGKYDWPGVIALIGVLLAAAAGLTLRLSQLSHPRGGVVKRSSWLIRPPARLARKVGRKEDGS